MENQEKITASITEGTKFRKIFEGYGIPFTEAELEKTKVLYLHFEGKVVSFASFTNSSETTISITHSASPDEWRPTLFAVLDDYCLNNGIKEICASIPTSIRGLLAIYKRAGFKKLCDGFVVSSGDETMPHTHDLRKEIK